jgi:hypothetical protein
MKEAAVLPQIPAWRRHMKAWLGSAVQSGRTQQSPAEDNTVVQ